MDVGQEEALLRLPAVKSRTGLCTSALYARMAAGTFPRPLKRGAASVWVKSEIDTWVREEISRLPRMGTSMGARKRLEKKAA